MSGPRIRQLSAHIVNKIAAGEVIERPASVVKELVENALDAGASRIEVDVEAGGADLIRVRDDGHGIARDDLALLFASHATSKLADAEDLFHIVSLGFRGEALASIGSIAEVSVRTRARDADTGFEIRHVTGQDDEPKEAACSVGTTIEVRHLFRNVPVRRKFLRSPSAELGHVTESVTRTALAHPEVAFTLRHGKREVLRVEAVDHSRDRVRDLYDEDLARDLIPVSHRGEAFEISGHVAPPHRDRPRQDRMYVFLNGRFVKDRTLLHAVHEGYRGLLMNRRHPTVFLYLTLDPSLVDVNVHPTKIEVRFRDSAPLHRAVRHAIADALRGADMAPSATPPVSTTPRASGRKDAESVPVEPSIHESVSSYARNAPVRDVTEPTPTSPGPGAAVSARGEAPGGRGGPEPVEAPSRSERGAPAVPGGGAREAVTRVEAEAGGRGEPTVSAQPAESRAKAPFVERSDGPDRVAGGQGELARPIELGAEPVQIHNTYILRQTEDGFTLTDQHALHERILYHEILDRVRGDEGVAVQRLLIPEVLDLSAAETERLLDHEADLRAVGFEVKRFGERSVAFHTVPHALRRLRIRELVDQLLLHADPEGGGGGEKDFVDALVEMAACKAAIKAGDPLESREMRDLLRQGEELPTSYACPHGRPTTIQVSLGDLEKWFRRRVP